MCVCHRLTGRQKYLDRVPWRKQPQINPSGCAEQLRLAVCSRGIKALMPTPASLRKHLLHPIFVTLPIGLWVFVLICDIARSAGDSSAWQVVVTYCIGGGIAGAVLAAIPGLIDYFSIDEAAMRWIANLHLTINLGAVVLFAVDLWLRFTPPADSLVPLVLAVSLEKKSHQAAGFTLPSPPPLLWASC
jgi:uncharacterized membrane protein